MVNQELETRNLSLEIRSAEDRVLEGYAIVTNSESEDLGFREIVAPEALEGLIEKSDCLMLLEHNRDKGILARSRFGKGSLQLSVDEKGLKFRFKCPNTQLGDEAYEGVSRGDYSSCSFAFVADKDSWQKRSNGEYLRTIHSFKFIKDCSIVAEPAYAATEVSCRSFDEFKKEEEKALEEQRAKEKLELDNYFNDLKELIK